jgi:hypothetical protein
MGEDAEEDYFRKMIDLTKRLLKNIIVKKKMTVWEKNDRWKICIRKITVLTKRLSTNMTEYNRLKKRTVKKFVIIKKGIKKKYRVKNR